MLGINGCRKLLSKIEALNLLTASGAGISKISWILVGSSLIPESVKWESYNIMLGVFTSHFGEFKTRPFFAAISAA